NQSLAALVHELKAIPGYRALFDEAFPGQGITPETIGMAIATYERTVVSSRAPFDRWIDGDETAISQEAQRGFVVFNNRAGCAACHSGWAFTDASFHDIGLPSDDLGRGELLPDIDVMQYAFKTPGLRDIERRAPYMHDGSLETLEDVVDHYIAGGIPRESLSAEMRPLDLSAQERDDLIAFLRTVTGPLNPVVLPVLPR
ncbi:MAG: cytochrome-c peroxidase, partial [Bacteroidota bacterium]